MKKLKKRTAEEFYKNSLRGFNAKVLLEHLFKEAGYETYPFGYESLFSRITSGINRDGEQTSTLQRIRSMPDLLVVDNTKKRVHTLLKQNLQGIQRLIHIFNLKRRWIGTIPIGMIQ